MYWLKHGYLHSWLKKQFHIKPRKIHNATLATWPLLMEICTLYPLSLKSSHLRNTSIGAQFFVCSFTIQASMCWKYLAHTSKILHWGMGYSEDTCKEAPAAVRRNALWNTTWVTMIRTARKKKDHISSLTEFEPGDFCLHYKWQCNSLLTRR